MKSISSVNRTLLLGMAILLTVCCPIWAATTVIWKTLPQNPNMLDRLVSCTTLLMNMNQNVATNEAGNKAIVHIGEISELDALLAAAGSRDEDREFLIKAVNIVAERSADPLISQIVNRLKNQMDKLMVCVADSSCKFVNAYASLTKAQWMDSDKTVFVQDLQMRSYSESQAVLEAPKFYLHVEGSSIMDLAADGGGMRILALPNISGSVDKALWVAGFYHEMTHFEDTFVIHEWIKANRRRKAMGLKGDALFEEYTRQVGEKLVISNDFFVVFTESRAYSIMAKSLEPLVTDKVALKAFDERMRIQAYKYLLSKVGQPFLEKLGANEENILHVWKTLLGQMKF